MYSFLLFKEQTLGPKVWYGNFIKMVQRKFTES